MKHLIRMITPLLLICGCIGITYFTKTNAELAADISRLEAELGKMTIADPNRIYLTEIKDPDVPSEVAMNLKGIWQFRCYMPPGYDVVQINGSGNISEEGVYHDGGYSSGWGNPSTEAVHQLITLSIQKRGDQLLVFHSLGGSSGTTSWNDLQSADFDAFVIKSLVKSEQGQRSFDMDSILPILKIYDPASAQERNVAGTKLTTFRGGLFVLYPKARDSHFQQLRNGITPTDFDSNWLAKELNND